MKFITILLLLLLLASPAFGELTKEDLRTIIKDEVTASEKRLREYIDLKIETVNARIDATNTRIDATNTRIDALEKSLNARIDATNTRIDATNTRIDELDKRMTDMWRLMMGLFGLVAATIAIPQIIIAYRDKDRKEMQSRQEALQTEIQQLREQIEAQPPPPNPVPSPV